MSWIGETILSSCIRTVRFANDFSLFFILAEGTYLMKEDERSTVRGNWMAE